MTEKYLGINNIASEIVRENNHHWNRPWEVIEDRKKILRESHESLVEVLGMAPLPTDLGDWTYIAFGDRTSGAHHDMVIYGNLEEESLGDGEDILMRMHSSCRTNEVHYASNCECRESLQVAMKMIKDEGRGIIVYLEQEGRGTGISGKMLQLGNMFEWRDGKIQQKMKDGVRVDTDTAYKQAGLPSECRDFSVAGDMLKKLGIKSVRMLTNNPGKIEGLEQEGIRVTRIESHIAPKNEIIQSDLISKAENLGHMISGDNLSIMR